MKISIEVECASEADLIRIGLSDPMTRAFVEIVGALLPLESERARRRVLQHVADKVAEENENARKAAVTEIEHDH